MPRQTKLDGDLFEYLGQDPKFVGRVVEQWHKKNQYAGYVLAAKSDANKEDMRWEWRQAFGKLVDPCQFVFSEGKSDSYTGGCCAIPAGDLVRLAEFALSPARSRFQRAIREVAGGGAGNARPLSWFFECFPEEAARFWLFVRREHRRVLRTDVEYARKVILRFLREKRVQTFDVKKIYDWAQKSPSFADRPLPSPRTMASAIKKLKAVGLSHRRADSRKKRTS